MVAVDGRDTASRGGGLTTGGSGTGAGVQEPGGGGGRHIKKF